MDYTKQIEYWYSWEYATRSPEVLTDENRNQIIIYDCHENREVDISGKTVDELAKWLATISADWRKITEDEFYEIINKK